MMMSSNGNNFRVPCYWPFVRGIHQSPVDSSHKCQWREASMFSLICDWTNGWANNRDAGDMRRRRARYDITVMQCDNRGLIKRLYKIVNVNDNAPQAFSTYEIWKYKTGIIVPCQNICQYTITYVHHLSSNIQHAPRIMPTVRLLLWFLWWDISRQTYIV